MSANSYKIISGCKDRKVPNLVPGKPDLTVPGRGPHVIRFAEISLEFVSDPVDVAEKALKGRLDELEEMIQWLDENHPSAIVAFRFNIFSNGYGGKETMIGSVDAEFEKLKDFVLWKLSWS